MTAPRTVRGVVTPLGDVLLKPRPGLPCWLAELLRDCAGAEVLITVTVEGLGVPDWLEAAARALEAPRPLLPPRHERALRDPAARARLPAPVGEG